MPATPACVADAFAAAMSRMAPFEPAPALAVAVSGGADSMALALLTRDWVRPRSGSILALVVDHGLRSGSGDEARVTIERLGSLGITARLLRLANLQAGPAVAERARIMRYHALAGACRAAGIPHLLLGHHAADQVETLMMRVLRGSRTHGLAGMAALRETEDVRLLRPLLAIEPAALRLVLRGTNTDWVEDLSNRDMRALRPRLRQRLAGQAPATTGMKRALASVGALRSYEEAEIAAELAERVTIRPEGFALISPYRISAAALNSLVRTIGGMAYPVSPGQISDLAARPRPATVAGVRLLLAGRLGDGLLVTREEDAVMPPVAMLPDMTWDNRFRLITRQTVPGGARVGKLGAGAAGLRGWSDLPSSVLRTLPAIRIGDVVTAVPHLGYASHGTDTMVTMVLFSPCKPLGGPGFFPAGEAICGR